VAYTELCEGFLEKLRRAIYAWSCLSLDVGPSAPFGRFRVSQIPITREPSSCKGRWLQMYRACALDATLTPTAPYIKSSQSHNEPQSHEEL